MLDTFIKLILRIITKDRIHGRIKKRDLLSPFVRTEIGKRPSCRVGKRQREEIFRRKGRRRGQVAFTVDNESISRIRYVGHDTCQIHRP